MTGESPDGASGGGAAGTTGAAPPLGASGSGAEGATGATPPLGEQQNAKKQRRACFWKAKSQSGVLWGNFRG